jgi:hypothetical protein
VPHRRKCLGIKRIAGLKLLCACVRQPGAAPLCRTLRRFDQAASDGGPAQRHVAMRDIFGTLNA